MRTKKLMKGDSKFQGGEEILFVAIWARELLYASSFNFSFSHTKLSEWCHT